MSTAQPARGRLTFIIFSAVGVLNTIFDFVLYYILFNVTGSILVANLISTTAALTFSYLINSRYTFKNKRWTIRSFIAFFVVTVFGLWVLQTAVIYLCSHYLYLIPDAVWSLFGPFATAARTLAPKVLATGVTFIWNYLWYSRVIFKNDSKQTQVVTALDDL